MIRQRQRPLPNREHGFTLIEITMILVLLGILAAVAVPKYFDLQEESRMRAAQTAIAEAQARINAHFSEKVLTGLDCASAVQSVNDNMDSIADAPNKVFGEFQLAFEDLPSDGTAVPVTVSYNGTPLGTEAIGTLVAPQCTAGSGAGAPSFATGPTSLAGFGDVKNTGNCSNGAAGIGGVVAKYPQINCTQSATAEMINAAKLAFEELLPTLGEPFNSIEDVGYWRVFDLGNGKKSLLWTETEIKDITGPERVPFIQATDDGSGNMTYFVGLTTVTRISVGNQTQAAMMIQDSWGKIGQVWSEDYVSNGDRDYLKDPTTGQTIGGRYVVESNGSYVFSTAPGGFTDYQQALNAYNKLTDAFESNPDWKSGQIEKGSTAFVP